MIARIYVSDATELRCTEVRKKLITEHTPPGCSDDDQGLLLRDRPLPCERFPEKMSASRED